MEYVIGLGSNRCHGRYGSPRRVVTAALDLLPALQRSPIVTSRPLGPSQRFFANAVAMIHSELPPPLLLAHLQSIERHFGRRAGRRWGARVLDLDILLWSGGIWNDRTLSIPHRQFRARSFVLTPLATIAPRWRDPATGHTIRQLKARLDRANACP